MCEDNLICDNYYNFDLTECLDNIPLGYYLNNSVLKTIDKCNIKCLNCTVDSNKNDLCISCNINESYYQKYNDSFNNNSFINCYKEDIENYYLDKNNEIFMPCYSICKSCNWKGDEYENNCTECYDNYTLINGNCKEISINTNIEELENKTNEELNNNKSEEEDYSYYSSSNSIFIEDSSENINDDYLSESSFTSFNIIDSITNNLYDNNSVDNLSDNVITIEYYINKYLNSNDISNYSFYYYEIYLNENKIENKYSNITFIELSLDSKNILINNFNLDLKNDKLYILIIEYLFNDLNSVVRNYDYKFFLENGTILDINEDIYADIYLPLIDLISSNYNYSIYFAEQGYDIYNKNSNFYNDKCSPAYLYNNDITISDRKKDIYPNNVILCKDNCQYKGFIIDEKIVICDCNLNINNNYSKSNDTFLKEEDNGNFFSYFLDNINYGILKCYTLINKDSLKKNYAFYSAFLFLFIIIIINILFWLYGISNIRKIIIQQIPTPKKLYNDFVREMLKVKEKNKKILSNPPIKRIKIKKRKNIKSKTFNVNKKSYNKFATNKDSTIINSSKIKVKLNTLKILKTETKSDEKKENFNELPFTLAIKKDKRNILVIFLSVIIEKLELVNLIFGGDKIKIVLIYQYILSLLIDLFLNAFLYTDELVSNKYHNNGKLDFIVLLTITLLSNLFNSIICNYLNFSKGVEERLEQIIEIKKEFNYLYAFNKFIKILKIKVMLYFLIEILIICFSFYYIIIFCILYNNSQISLLINYLMSIIESLILSIFICIVIAVTRKTGINYLNKNIYNTSKYINNAF